MNIHYSNIFVFLSLISLPSSLQCEDFVKAGATQAKSISDLVKQTDIVISMLSDSEALRAVRLHTGIIFTYSLEGHFCSIRRDVYHNLREHFFPPI